jgi:hypothetical protein
MWLTLALLAGCKPVSVIFPPDPDRDGDGFLADDCDDTRADVNPGVDPADDAWYDGVDQDCAGNDDFDQDGDRYLAAMDEHGQAITLDVFADYCIANGYISDAADVDDCWGQLYGIPAAAPQLGDCLDTDPNVHPGAVDVVYDGLDSDCQGDDDYDYDGDGFVAPQFATLSALPSGDCDDLRADVYPGAPDDAWYDGIDQDCAGNNDYDADGDRFMPDTLPDGSALDPQALAVFCVRYALATGPSDLDACWASMYGIAPAEPAYGDCDDDDPAVNPAATEDFADGDDQDCDGVVDVPAWQSAGATWDTPRAPVVGRDGQHYLLTTIADVSSWTAFEQAGFTLIFDPSAPFDAEPTAQPWHNQSSSPNATGGAVDMLTVADGFYPVVQYWSAAGGGLGIFAAFEEAWDARGSYLAHIQIETYDAYGFFSDADAVADVAGRVWTLGCGDSTFTFLAGALQSGTYTKLGGACGADASSSSCVDVAYAGGVTCFVDPPATGDVAQGTICDGAGCTTYDLDVGVIQSDIRVATQQPYAAETWTQVNQTPGWRVANHADPTTGLGVAMFDGVDTYVQLSGFDVRSAEASSVNGVTYVAAAVADQDGDGLGDVVLAYGDASGAMTTLVTRFEVDGVVYDARYASIHADTDRVFYAVSGDGTAADMVAWAFVTPLP